MKIFKKIISAAICVAAAANLCICASAETALKDVKVTFSISGEEFTYGVKEVDGTLFKAEKLSDTSCRLLFENVDVDVTVTDSIEIIPIDETKLTKDTKAYGDAAPYQLFCGTRGDSATVCDGENYTEIPLKRNYYTLNGKRAVEFIFTEINDEKLIKVLTEYKAMGVYFLDLNGHSAPTGESSGGNIPLVRKSDEKLSVEEKGNILIESYSGSPLHNEIILDKETVVKTKRMGKKTVLVVLDNIKLDLTNYEVIRFEPVFTEKMPKQFEIGNECCPFDFVLDIMEDDCYCIGKNGPENISYIGYAVNNGDSYSAELTLKNLSEEAVQALVEADGMLLSLYDSENGQRFLPSGNVAGDDAALVMKTEILSLTDSDVDVNGDGKANSLDALYILKEIVSGNKLSDKLDIDQNGKVNSLDALAVLRYVVS